MRQKRAVNLNGSWKKGRKTGTFFWEDESNCKIWVSWGEWSSSRNVLSRMWHLALDSLERPVEPGAPLWDLFSWGFEVSPTETLLTLAYWLMEIIRAFPLRQRLSLAPSLAAHDVCVPSLTKALHKEWSVTSLPSLPTNVRATYWVIWVSPL